MSAVKTKRVRRTKSEENIENIHPPCKGNSRIPHNPKWQKDETNSPEGFVRACQRCGERVKYVFIPCLETPDDIAWARRRMGLPDVFRSEPTWIG